MEADFVEAVFAAGVHDVGEVFEKGLLIGADEDGDVLAQGPEVTEGRIQFVQFHGLSIDEKGAILGNFYDEVLIESVLSCRFNFGQGEVEGGNIAKLHGHEEKEDQDDQHIHQGDDIDGYLAGFSSQGHGEERLTTEDTESTEREGKEEGRDLAEARWHRGTKAQRHKGTKAQRGRGREKRMKAEG